MPDQNDDTPKIFVDDDWKAQAKREQAEQDAASREAAGGEEMPEPSILEIVNLLVMQATAGLGLMQDPRTGQPMPGHLPTAKHFIDLLELLGEKTKGNLGEEEQGTIERYLHDLRMLFVEVQNQGGQAPPPGAPDAGGQQPPGIAGV